MVIAVSVFTLLFVPNTFFGPQIRTNFDGGKFECGGGVNEVWTIANGTALRIRTSGRDYELKYFGSTLARDHYRSQTGEEADYDAELNLSGFTSGASGTCY
jgi:hypothetical protein